MPKPINSPLEYFINRIKTTKDKKKLDAIRNQAGYCRKIGPGDFNKVLDAIVEQTIKLNKKGKK